MSFTQAAYDVQPEHSDSGTTDSHRHDERDDHSFMKDSKIDLINLIV